MDMKLAPMTRPTYLDLESPRAALIAYHTEKAGNVREALTGIMMCSIDMAFRAGFDTPEEARAAGFVVTPEEWWEQTEQLAWDDSPTAVLRDLMRFHERCIEELVNV